MVDRSWRLMILQGSPLHDVPSLSARLGVDLYVKRDDLLPIIGGGNKARKIRGFVEKAEALGCDALITTGGVQSNHARVTALEAAARGWCCSLVLHGSSQALQDPRGNLRLMLLTGANVTIVSANAVGQKMQVVEQQLRADGHKPLVIPGGGHSPIGALAYADAVSELKSQCEQLHWCPDWLVIASGTGTTQAGLIVGLERLAWRLNVVGISVARRNPRGAAIVREACSKLRKHMGLCEHETRVDFRDGWVGEGYERADLRVWKTIHMAAELDGLVLDPTYTGKAFLAMTDMIACGEIHEGDSVLFWHTGGLMNLLAADPSDGILSES